ncbi:radical SAM protein [Candidatus Woesearchaeota archaeon]|nr:radical SAM protein [Candidatus Woesearchaeota archaeon]
MSSLAKAQEVFKKNFKPVTWFERTIFFSWYCGIADCRYCYMSTQKDKIRGNRLARRTTESILAETILCKKLGWPIGFISGGHDAFTKVEFRELVANIHNVYGQKLWLNVGPMKREELEPLLPYTKGVIAAVETVNPDVHSYVCPSKPVKPMESMLSLATGYRLKKGMTIILGLGETMDDYERLRSFIRKHNISKIHFYGLNPQKGTVFENSSPPNASYQAEWIARTRIDFPKMDIQAGIWVDRVRYVSRFLDAGANSISKFPAIRLFNKKPAKELEAQAKKAGRRFLGTMTELPRIDIKKETKMLEPALKAKVRKKLEQYLEKMQ